MPPGVVNIVSGFGPEAGAPLVEHPKVNAISFTGSSEVGRMVGSKAASLFKPCSLEMGGKNAMIVMDDANLDLAVEGALWGAFGTTGQRCTATSRILLHKKIAAEFTSRLVKRAKALKVGDGLDEKIQMGPQINPQQSETAQKYVAIAKAEGAKLLCGGSVLAKGEHKYGYFFEPTIFGGVKPKMRIAQEEVFGPVLAVIPFEDEAEAVAIANDSSYGLAAGVWTQDTSRVLRMAEALKTGMVWVNMYRAVSYMSPFGGVKRSGLGHENGMEAIKDYVQTKSVWISTAEETPDPFVLG
jgi:aldehyde dehydrogenase (NAD+)